MQFLNQHRGIITTLLIIALLLSLGVPNMSVATGVSILLSGLTLAALYFLVAGGLSLIFGLMDVLNFAHGSLFMFGTYAGWSFYTAPFLLGLDSNLRFFFALTVGGAVAALLGGLMEWGLIRPLYSRPIYQILLTLGLVFVADQVVRAIWGPTGYVMEIPSFFNTPSPNCPSDNLLAWFGDHCDSIMIVGRAFPSYRLFIILVGVIIALVVAVVLRRSRLGMIIRAGVQDSQMVEALGINVRLVFTLVFALGAGIAGLGGVVAAPFLGVSPSLALEFLLQAFIVVVIGGMGSVPGAALGALLVGLARAYGDHLVLAGIQLPGMADAISGSPAIARASTVLIMAIVLLIRPTGIFGKKE